MDDTEELKSEDTLDALPEEAPAEIPESRDEAPLPPVTDPELEVDFSTGSLEAIMAEFSGDDIPEEDPENSILLPFEQEELARQADAPDTAQEVTAEDTSLSDPVEPDAVTPRDAEESEAFPEFDSVPADEEYVPNPIVFQPPSRLKQLRKKLVIGPEHRYYELSELGLGKLQLAIIIMIACFLLTAAATAFFFLRPVPDNRVRFLVFSQVMGILVSALMGCYLIMEGIGDLFHGRFTPNTMLVVTLIACSVDAFFCLTSLELPFGAVFALETVMALWAAYEKRNTEMGEMDTMRRAVRLDAVTAASDYRGGRNGLILRDGEVEEFMDTYNLPSGPEKTQSVFCLIAFVLSLGVSAAAYFLHGMDYAVRVLAASLLCAFPATAFISLTRPKAILERRLHRIGSVICGWQGVKALRKDLIFPLSDTDLFPIGSVKLNGVKFFGQRNPDQVIGYAAALAEEQGSSLLPIFRQLRESRNCRQYSAGEFRFYDNGGIGGILNEEAVLMGSRGFMAEMHVDLPDRSPVENAIYMAIDNRLCAVFALTYTQNKSTAKGLSTLCSYRSLTPMVVGTDFVVGADLLTKKYRIRLKRMEFAPLSQRKELLSRPADPEAPALALVSRDTLSAKAFVVTGSRCLYRGTCTGLAVHILAGVLGLLIMAAVAILGIWDLLTPANVLLYQLVWAIPGILVTEWTRSV